MRVTCAVREYVRKVVLSKVQDRIDAAEKAKAAAKDACEGKVAKAEAIAEKLAQEAQEKFLKQVAKLGLTFVEDTYDYMGRVRDKNEAFNVNVGSDDFVETTSADAAMRAHPCKERDEFVRVCKEPDRIRKAANMAADKLLFELELGKVAKKELDELLKDMKVEV